MRIGITEQGDSSIDYSWVDKLNFVDGAIIITKNLTDKFIDTFIEQSKSHKLILHCTCTGWGHSTFEPNIPTYKEQLSQLKKLTQKGFNPKYIVLRIDPIIPTKAGLQRVEHVLSLFKELDLDITRIRISIYDEYPHVKERLINMGYSPCYSNFQANETQLKSVIDVLSKFNYKYEVCAEGQLYKLKPEIFSTNGCVSYKDLKLFNIEANNLRINNQNRLGCCCLSCKTELLENKKRCPYKCTYCYWQD